MQARRQRSSWCACLALLLWVAAAPNVRAEVWAFIDDAGRVHFAARQQDARYQLFYRGSSTLDPSAADASAAQARAVMERSPLYRRIVTHPNARRYAPLIERTAVAFGLDTALVKAIVAVESGYDPAAVSTKGAVGLMQVLPETGERYGVAADARRTVADKLMDPGLNVRIGARYLADLLKLFAGDRTLALAAYNAGEQAVRQYGNQVPPFAETQDYVDLVTQFERFYLPPPPPPPSRPVLDLPGKRTAPR